MPTRKQDDVMVEVFQRDPNYALDLLNSILADGDAGELLIMLRHYTRAFGGVKEVAETAKLNPTQLYRALSIEGNPTLSSLKAVLKAMGLQLAVRHLADPGHDLRKSVVAKRKKPRGAQTSSMGKVVAAR